MFSKLKFFLLNKIVGKELSCISYIIRKGYTDKNRGEDQVIDDALWAVSLGKVFGNFDSSEILRKPDPAVVKDISTKIMPEIEKEVKDIILQNEEFNLIPIKSDKEKKIELRSKSIIKMLSFWFKNYKSYKIAYDYFKIRNMSKASLTYEHLIKGISLLTPVLLIGGIFRNFIIAKEFKFDVELVFQLSDYISSSLTCIIYSIIPMIVTLSVVFIAHVEDSGLDPKSKKIEIEKSKKDSKFILFLIVVVIIGNTITRKRFDYQIILIIAILLLIPIILPKMIKRYFKNGLFVWSIFSFLIMFLINIFNNTIRPIDMVKTGKMEKNYQIEFVDDIILPSNLRFITKSSNYTIFYEPNNLETIIIKNEDIKITRSH
jgi:hypothetical protein